MWRFLLSIRPASITCNIFPLAVGLLLKPGASTSIEIKYYSYNIFRGEGAIFKTPGAAFERWNYEYEPKSRERFIHVGKKDDIRHFTI